MCQGRKKGECLLLWKSFVVFVATLSSLLGLITNTDFARSLQTLASKLELMFFRKHGFFLLIKGFNVNSYHRQIWYQTFHCFDNKKQTCCTFNKHQKGCLLRNFWSYSLTTVTSSRVFSLQPSRNYLRQILNFKLWWSNYLRHQCNSTLKYPCFWSEIKHTSSRLGLLQTNDLTV